MSQITLSVSFSGRFLSHGLLERLHHK